MKTPKRLIAVLLCVSLVTSGCFVPPLQHGHGEASFDAGLAAIEKKDFSAASYHFAQLAKKGDTASMNNLGVALIMVDRKDEAVYWLERAVRYGDDANAANTLRQMGHPVPAADLMGQHGEQLAQKESERMGQVIVEAVFVGLLLGVTINSAKYSGRQAVGPSTTSLTEPKRVVRVVEAPQSARFVGSTLGNNSSSFPNLRVTPSNGYSSSSSTNYEVTATSTPFTSAFGSRELEVRNQDNRFRGTIEKNGDFRLRGENGEELRGYINESGVGKFTDQNGVEYKVQPK